MYNLSFIQSNIHAWTDMPTSVYLLPLHNDKKNDEGEDDKYQHDDKSDDSHAEP